MKELLVMIVLAAVAGSASAGVLQSGFGADRSVAETVSGDVTKRLTPPVVEPL